MSEELLTGLFEHLKLVSDVTSRALVDVRDAFDKDREIARATSYLEHERFILAAIKDLVDSLADNIPVVTK